MAIPPLAPPGLVFQEPSLWKGLCDKAFNVSYFVVSLLASTSDEITLDPELTTKVETLAKKIQQFTFAHLQNTYAAVCTLKRNFVISNAALIEYGAYLSEKHAGFHMLDLFLHPNNGRFSSFSDVLTKKEELPKGTSILGIPIVLEGILGDFTQDHVVAVLFDMENNRIEYYDPKGLTCRYQKGRSLIASPPILLLDLFPIIDLPSVLHILKGFYGNGSTTVLELKRRDQADLYNCGVYVARYYRERLSGTPPETMENPDIQIQRKTMIENIVERALKSPPQETSSFDFVEI